GAPKANAAAAPARSPRRALAAPGPAASLILQNVIAIHDVGDLLIAVATQGGGHQCERGLTLLRRQVAKTQTLSLKNPGGQVRPAGPLAAGEIEGAFGTLRIGERC